jgi:RND family efflux transporter MFP subunit
MKPRLMTIRANTSIAAVIAAIAALAACAGATWAAEPAAPLQTVPVELRRVATAWPAEALVEAARQAAIEAQIAGRIAELPFDVGQTVRRGQVLARIEDREAGVEVGAREARLLQAEAALLNARTQYERAQRVRQADPDALSASALDQARAAYEAALAAQRAAAAERGLAQVTAPFDGVVARRDAAVGDMAVPGKPLLTLYDPSSLRLIADIPSHRLAAVQARPRVRLEAAGKAGADIEAQRIEFLPVTDARTQSVRARVYLPAGSADLRPGSFVRLSFATEEAPRLVIARQAVLRRGELTAAYVVGPDGSLALRQIRLGQAIDEASVEVLAGLAPGETLARDPVEAGVLRAASRKAASR